MQIRGFKLRLPLEIQFLFTANPEDYTNRGSIITPLKDRIESQILTHYPKTIDIALRITDQAVQMFGAQGVSQDTPLARQWTHLRTLRLADGPDAVHRRQVARAELAKYQV